MASPVGMQHDSCAEEYVMAVACALWPARRVVKSAVCVALLDFIFCTTVHIQLLLSVDLLAGAEK